MNNPTWKAAFVVSLRLEQTQRIGAEEGRAPTEHTQQVSVESVDTLRLRLRLRLTQGPLLAGSAAALLLVQLLKRKAARRRSTRSGHAEQHHRIRSCFSCHRRATRSKQQRAWGPRH